MDKTPELNPSPENLPIPENWNFPERDERGIEVVQIDLGERFLAVQPPRNLQDPNITHPLYLYGSEEFFFNKDGEEVALRSHQKLETYIGFRGGEFSITYTLPVGAPETYSSSLMVHFDSGEAGGRLGGAIYDGGMLRFADLGKFFITKDVNGALVKSPRLVFGSYEIATSDEKRTFGLNKELSGNDFVVEIQGKNEAAISSNQNEKLFAVSWRIQEGEQEKVPILVVSQTHIPSDIVKTLRAPLKVDYDKVVDAGLLSKPPYRKSEKGRLVVPWTNIDRIVGASLSYSYPPPKKQK